MTMKTSRRGHATYITNKGITKMKQMSDVKARIGRVTLSSGSVIVPSTTITSASLVFITPQTDSVNAGTLGVIDITPGVSFTIDSSNVADDRVVAFFILEG